MMAVSNAMEFEVNSVHWKSETYGGRLRSPPKMKFLFASIMSALHSTYYLKGPQSTLPLMPRSCCEFDFFSSWNEIVRSGEVVRCDCTVHAVPWFFHTPESKSKLLFTSSFMEPALKYICSALSWWMYITSFERTYKIKWRYTLPNIRTSCSLNFALDTDYKGDYNNEPPSHLLRWKLEAVPELAPNGIIHPKQDIEITHQGCSWLLKSGGDLRTIGENV